ncbi:hypothetical protein Godav_024262 [Gossypium davidsonii]|uniref:F-box associated domain-containing protein n=1 Tax=Gossypium davidsonii TaxID=34287 RepID=A0A7J8SUH8_GOSDV|nr:hypothetical protein [Gossypium davidsonii]
MSQVELYSLKCDSWKEILSPNYAPCGLNWEFFESYREHYIQVLVFNLINRLVFLLTLWKELTNLLIYGL